MLGGSDDRQPDPHPLHLYPWYTPERIQPGSISPTQVIPPSDHYPPARLGHVTFGTGLVEDGVEIEDLAFGADNARADGLPEPVPGTWFVVSLVVALAATHRTDLLVPHLYVRDLDGSVIGSRKLGCPVRLRPTEAGTPIAAATPIPVLTSRKQPPRVPAHLYSRVSAPQFQISPASR